ncbi:MAG TPA: cytochrome B [Bacteroidetes bacterium]|nr:cytochrome B [Bacteroidota bacterium]
MKSVKIYNRFERFWHWMQAALIIFLAMTGLEIHGSFTFFGYEQAVRYHSTAAVFLMILIVFAIFWHFTTGNWKQYLPTFENLRAQIDFYLTGIFRGAAHPVKRDVLSKLNPIQRLVYLGLKILVIPIMVSSGLLYMYYRYPQREGMVGIGIFELKSVAVLHTLGAYILIAFIITHLYLITTGQTVGSNLKAMITGWEDIEDDDDKVYNPKTTEIEVKADETTTN